MGSQEAASGAVAGLQRAQEQGRVDPGVPALQLDRARHLAVHLSGEHSDRAALFRGGAAGRRARRSPHHGRRRADAARARREADDEERPLPHAGLLSAVGRGRARRHHAAANHPGNAADDHVRTSGPRHRPRPGRVDGEEEAGGVFLMAHVSNLIETDIEKYLESHQYKSLLRFITCGSVDDGKSTLIGRLLYESKMIFEDQLAALEADSKKMGTQGEAIDFALLVDGLAAEREQGITIDVAYRFFSTDRRKFIVADTPGHEQYTRNMITGASTADLAVILIDARKGVLTQTRRHSYLVSLVGIRHVVLAVNKLDLVGYSEHVFNEIDREYRAFIERLNGSIEQVTSIPLSALRGDNIAEASANTPWYTGPSLLEFLEEVRLAVSPAISPLRMPVQWVNRPNLDFRGFSGRILGGTVKPGDAVRVLPSGRTSTVARIVSLDGDKAQAVSGESVTLTLTDEIDISRGDVICSAHDPAGLADQFEATIAWMSEEAMLPGRAYLVKIGASTVGGSISKPKYVVEVNTLDRLVAKTLRVNEVGVCTLTLDRAVAFDPYAENRDMGSFIVIDRLTNHTIAAGTLHFALRRSQNIHWQALEV